MRANTNIMAKGGQSAVRQAVHSIFDDLRHDPAPVSLGNPYVATLSGMPRSGRSSAATSYIGSRTVDDAVERVLFEAGTPKRDAAAVQNRVADICVPELLALADDLRAEALSQPAMFLQRTWRLVKHGVTELVLIDGFDELLRDAIDARADPKDLGVLMGIESAKGFGRIVNTPVVHIGSPDYRKVLSEDPFFCLTWRWEVDLFRISETDEANTEYMFERFHSLGLLDMGSGGSHAKPDPKTGDLPGVVFDSAGNRVGHVSALALVEAVKSCGPGSIGFATDIRGKKMFSALLRFEPTAGIRAEYLSRQN